MYKLDCDASDNVITIRIEGIFDFQQADEVHSKMQTVLLNMKSGFTVVTDISLLEQMDPESLKSISKTMDLFNSHGIGRAIRVVPDSSKDIGFNIISFFHYSPKVKIRTFESMSKAREYIDAHKTQNA